MFESFSPPIFIIGLFFGMLIFFELGRKIGKVKLNRYAEDLAKGGGTIEVGIYSLLGLLIAFTFSGGASRFEIRRHLVTEEANAIGTAYLRIDVLPADVQANMRQLFREYLDSRLDTYRKLPDIKAAEEKLKYSNKLQSDIWTNAVEACRHSDSQAAYMLFLPALNQMIDISNNRFVATRNHPPLVIYILLVTLCLIGSLLAGYGMSESKKRNWLHMIVFAAILSLTVYVIIDLEYPRLGLIRVDMADQTLIDLRKGMD